jgi:hypothetical protein
MVSTRKANFLVIIIVSLIILPVIPSESSNLNDEKRLNNVYQSIYDYIWLWDEYYNAPGDLLGDEPLIWGGSLGNYHNYSETIEKLNLLAESLPELVKAYSIGQTYNGREIMCYELSNHSYTGGKTEFLLIGQMHAREAITLENILYLIDQIVSHYIVKAPLMTEFMKKTNLYIIPTLNPDGLKLLTKNPWQRRNGRKIDGDLDGRTDDEEEVCDVNGDNYISNIYVGDKRYLEGIDLDHDGKIGEDIPGGVDLNRNYPKEFIGTGSSDDPNSLVYRGPEPLSEFESQAIDLLAKMHDFNFGLSLHSGIQSVIFPWGYTTDPSPDDEEFYAVANQLIDLAHGHSITQDFGIWSDQGMYTVNGEWGDYMYAEYGIKAYTIETYRGPDYTTDYNGTNWISYGIWDFYNPAPSEVIELSEAIYEMMIHLANEPLVTYNNTLSEITSFTAEESSPNIVIVNWEISDADIDDLNIKVSYSTGSELEWVNVYETTMKTGELQFIPLSVQEEIMVKIVVDDGKQKVVAKRNLSLTLSTPTETTETTDVTDTESNETSPENNEKTSLGLIGMTVITLAVIVMTVTRKKKK